MSDQTTEATDHVPTGADTGNPSMEDILASIRRIIADDDAQVTPTPQTNTLDTNLNTLAATPPEIEAENSILLDTETSFDDDDIMDLEDILILDEEDFSDDTLEIEDSLEIPAMDVPETSLDGSSLADTVLAEIDILEQSLTAIDPEPVSEHETDLMDSLPLDRELDMDGMLEGSLADMDLVILDTPEVAIDNALLKADMPEAVEQSSVEINLDAPLIEDVFEAVEATTTPEMDPSETDALALGLDDEIFSSLDTDLDLVLDTEQATEFLTPENTSPDEMAAVLSVIDENISDIQMPEDQREKAAIEIEALLDGEADAHADETIDDIMSSLFENDETATEIPQVDASETLSETLVEPEIPDVMDDTDIELVKSLMADLTEDKNLSELTTETEIFTPEPILDADDEISNIADERDEVDDVLDDIFEMSLDDVEDDTTAAIEDPGIENVEASINSLLQIAASAEQDAQDAGVDNPAPTVLDVMPALDVTAPVITDDTEESIDTLFRDSLISAVEIQNADATVETADVSTPVPSLAIEALAAQTLALEDLLEAEDTTDTPDVLEGAELTPETTDVEDALPEPSVEDAILPEPEPEPETAPETSEAQPAPKIPTDDPAPKEETQDMTKAANESILDEVTETATSGAFASLNQLVEAQHEFEDSGPRIGDLVQEALRPMLKEWLDANLKTIVERAVQKEVKRISSGN